MIIRLFLIKMIRNILRRFSFYCYVIYLIIKNIMQSKSINIIMNGFKNFYVKQVRYEYKDIWFRTVISSIGKYIKVDNNCGIAKNCLNIASYDYLGINDNKQLTFSSLKYIYEENETNKYEQLLEYEIQKFLGFKYITISSSGYSANAIYLKEMVKNDSLILSDEYNHYSIIEGCKFIKNKIIFKHNNLDQLKNILEKNISKFKNNIYVIIEGLYSMHGHLFNIPGLIKLQDQFKFKIIIDEAHSYGCIGNNGKGSFDYYNINLNRIHCFIGTFSKAFNSHGGFIATNDEEVYKQCMVIKNSFDSPLPSLSCLHIINITKWIQTDEGHMKLKYLRDISNYTFRKLKKLSLTIYSDEYSPVICIDAGNVIEGIILARYAFENNIALVVVGYPAADMFSLTLRICISTSHTKHDIDYLISVLSRCPNNIYRNHLQRLEIPQVLSLDEFKDSWDCIQTYGIGTSGPAGFYGTLSICKLTELEISKKLGKESTTILPHGFNGMKSIKKYLNELGIKYSDITDILKTGNLHKYKSNFTQYKVLIGNLSELNILNVQGAFMSSDKNFMLDSSLSLKSYIFSASLPAYIYYNIYKYIKNL